MTATATRPPITPRTREFLAWIQKQYRERGYGCGVRELGKALGCSSPVAAYYHLKILEERGYVTRVAGRANSIIPVEG